MAADGFYTLLVDLATKGGFGLFSSFRRFFGMFPSSNTTPDPASADASGGRFPVSLSAFCRRLRRRFRTLTSNQLGLEDGRRRR